MLLLTPQEAHEGAPGWRCCCLLLRMCSRRASKPESLKCCAAKMDDEYKSFLAELGGAPQDQGGSSGMRPMGGGGGGGRQSRPGDDLPDNCKLYVGNLSPAVTDAVLKSLMEPFGNVLHAVVLLDMTTSEHLPLPQLPAAFWQLPLPLPAVVLSQGVAPVWRQSSLWRSDKPHFLGHALQQCLMICRQLEAGQASASKCSAF